MLEHKIKNLFIGTSFQNENFYIDTIDLKYNINKEFLFNFISEKEIKIINEKYEKYEYKSFCLDCKKNINNINCGEHCVQNYKDIIDNINIKEIEKIFNKMVENYNHIINKIEFGVKLLKQRNEEQIKLIKKIIEIYNLSLNSNNLTYQLLLNTKNILKFNNINEYENNPYIFNYNILQLYPIDNYIKENITITKFQKVTNLHFENKINSIIFLDKINKFIINSHNNIYLINSQKFSIESHIKTEYRIESLYLIKDKETILILHKKSINKLKIENNKLKIEDYIKEINIDSGGIIIDYKNDIAWTNKSDIFLNYNKTELTVGDEEVGYDQKIYIKNLYVYNDEMLLYLYLFYDSGAEYEALHFNYFKNEKTNNNKDIIFENGEEDRSDYDYLNTYKINNYRKNEIILICKTEINLINILNMQKIMKIKIKKTIYNSYILNNSYYLLFFVDDSNKKNNIMILKIKDEFNEIILKKKLKTGIYDELYYHSLNNNLNNSKLISIDYNEVNFHEINFNSKNTYFSKKYNVNKKKAYIDNESENESDNDKDIGSDNEGDNESDNESENESDNDGNDNHSNSNSNIDIEE